MGALRFLLAISVVANHSYPIFGHTLVAGHAVPVFFALAGFSMSLVLSGKYRTPVAFFVRRFARLYPLYITVAVATWAWWLFTWTYLGRMPTNGWYEHYRQMAWWNQALFMFSNWSMVGLDIQSLFHFRPDLGFLFFYAPDGAMSVGEFRTVGQAWSIGCLIWFYLMAPFVMKFRNRWIAIIGLTSLALDLAMTRAGLDTYFFFPAQLHDRDFIAACICDV